MANPTADFTIRHGITGTVQGKVHATYESAETAAIRLSMIKNHTLQIVRLTDAGRVIVAYVYQGDVDKANI